MKTETPSIDISKISPPKIDVDQKAIDQITLIKDNDFTLEGHVFRILIDGKGCDGFTYSTGFTLKNKDDITISVGPDKLAIAMDPFTAYYLQNATLSFEQTPHKEGFVVTNLEQDKYKGKFWLENESMRPPTTSL